MKYLIILEAVKNRRVFAFCLDLSHKLFGGEMMLLPRMSTTLCSMRFLKCDVGVCDELLEFCLMQESISPDIFIFPSAWTYLESRFHV